MNTQYKHVSATVLVCTVLVSAIIMLIVKPPPKLWSLSLLLRGKRIDLKVNEVKHYDLPTDAERAALIESSCTMASKCGERLLIAGLVEANKKISVENIFDIKTDDNSLLWSIGFTFDYAYITGDGIKLKSIKHKDGLHIYYINHIKCREYFFDPMNDWCLINTETGQ